jgi:hypothetical protein
MSAKDGEARIEAFFHKYAMNGVILSHEDLLKYARKRKILMTPALSKRLRYLRYRWKFTAAHSQPRKPSHYMGFSILNYGVLMIDMAFYNYFEEADEESTPERRITRSSKVPIEAPKPKYGGKQYGPPPKFLVRLTRYIFLQPFWLLWNVSVKNCQFSRAPINLPSLGREPLPR